MTQFCFSESSLDIIFGSQDPPEVVADALMWSACFSEQETKRSIANQLRARMLHPSFNETKTLGHLEPDQLHFLAAALTDYERVLPDPKSIAEAARMRNVILNGLDILAGRMVEMCRVPDCPQDLINGA